MTKRIIGILVAVLMVMALIPMSAFAKEAATRSGNSAGVANKTHATKDALITFDFETEPSDWTFVDDDGDGFNWGWEDCSETPHMTPYEGSGCIYSESYYNSETGSGGTVLYPDNWAITPAVEVPEGAQSLTFWVAGQDPSYAAEHFAVYAGTTPDIEDMTVIMPEAVATGTYTQQIVDITAYAGQTVYFAFRHFNVSDMFVLDIDLVEITNNAAPQPTEAPEPTEVPEVGEGEAVVILTVPTDHWQDGSGYQMLLDADATAYGTIIPETGGLTTSGDASAEVYAEFEYKIPENADGALDTANIVSCASVSIVIPAGVYDWCITNPTPGDRVWIASANGNVPGRYDNYVFQAGQIYEFTVTLDGDNDRVDLTMVNPLDQALNIEGGKLHFETSEDYPWEVFTDGDRQAAWSTNKGVASSTSYITTTVYAIAGDTISFEFMAWGEGSSSAWDKCEFLVNGEAVETWGAYQNNDWEGYIYEFTEEGTYELTWSYTKDSSVNPTGDYFAVDEVEFITSFDPLDRALNVQGGSLHFETSEDYPWIVMEEGDREYAMSGNAGVSSSTSTITLNVEGFEGDTLTFDFKAWGEGTYSFWDHCDFSVNGEVVFTYGAEDNDWTEYTYTLEDDGEFEFVWSYTKDSSVNPSGDYFAVDEVEFNTTGEPNLIIYEVDVEGFHAPMPDTTPADNMDVAPGAHAHYTITNVEWFDEAAMRYMDEDETFVEGNMYSVRYTVEVEEGYAYVSEDEGYLDMYINGGTTDVDYENSERYNSYVAYVWSNAVECGVTDLDRALNIEGGNLHFESEGDYPWVTVDEGDRFYAMSSNAGVNSSTSTVTTQVVVNAGDVVMFDFKAWGEGSSSFWDHCDFYVNNTRVLYYGAYQNDWESFAYIFETAGTYTLTWSYTKDSSVNPDGDYFAVDNVYVGEPEHVEQIIATENLEVEVNRTGVIEWTVLPENAVDKAVTFTVADESIATVDENGVVFGVAEGETDVTITSVDNPEVTAVCHVTVIDTGITAAQIYGIGSYDLGEVFTDQWITFTDVLPGTVTQLGTAPESYAAAYAYGTVFGFTTGGDFFTASIDDIANATYITGAASDYRILTMTFDYTRGCLFGEAVSNIDENDDNSYFLAIDPDSGAAELIGVFDNHMYGICVDENGVGYGVDGSGNLYSIDLDTAEMTVVGSTGVSCAYVQDICYDFNTGDIYWAQILDGDVHNLYRVNKETAHADALGEIGPSGAEVVGMFIIPDEEPEPAEDVPVESITINPTEAEIHVGDTFQFSAVVKPFNAADKDVEWTVDDEDIIVVDPDGMVIGLAEGTAIVTVTSVSNPDVSASAIVNVLPPKGDLLEGWYFESQDEVDEWTFVDDDGDGYNWEWSLGEVISAYLNLSESAYEGSGMIVSESYYNPDYLALTPDNWAVSPAIELPAGSATLTFYSNGQDPEYAAEHFQVYAGTTPDITEMTAISDEIIVDGDWAEYEFDLTDFAGGTVYVAIRHFNVTDQFILNVDQVEIWSNEGGDQPGEPLWGDANGDGIVDSADVLLTMRYVQELDTIDDENLPWVDVNGDGVINMEDALLIARYTMELIDHFPVEEEPIGE